MVGAGSERCERTSSNGGPERSRLILGLRPRELGHVLQSGFVHGSSFVTVGRRPRVETDPVRPSVRRGLLVLPWRLSSLGRETVLRRLTAGLGGGWL